MSSKYTKILEFNQYHKSDKAPFVIYPDLECLTAKTDGCKNNPENSSATKVGEHIPSSFLMPMISSFKSIKNKYDVHRGKNCMKKLCESLRENAIKIINQKMKLLAKEQQESYKNAKICYICIEKHEKNMSKKEKL